MATCYYCMTPTVRFGRECSVCGRSPSPKDPHSNALPPGTKLDGGSVVIGEKLGEGGFGITYIGRDTQNDAVICVKEFYPRQMTAGRSGTSVLIQAGHEEKYEHSMRAFNREARTIHVLCDHPNIVNVSFTIDENNTSYYGMELLHGQTLEEFAKNWVRENAVNIDARNLCLILNPIMDAIAFCHKVPILHRDISPKNIMICGSDSDLKSMSNSHTFSVLDNRVGLVEPKLIDFGASYTAMANFTQSMQAVALEGFSSPEQALANKKAQGTWSDVYSFAATVYYCLTMTKPPSSLDLLTGQQTLVPPSRLVSSISPAVEAVIMTGLEPNREKRYRSIRDFQRDFCAACRVKPYFGGWVGPGNPPQRTLGRLVCINGPLNGKSWSLKKPRVVLGRSETSADVQLEDASVSKSHCVLELSSGHWLITDLGSTNGTLFRRMYNGKPIMWRIDARRQAYVPAEGFRIGRNTYVIEKGDYDRGVFHTVELREDSYDTEDASSTVQK